jgi:hypothetical protein
MMEAATQPPLRRYNRTLHRKDVKAAEERALELQLKGYSYPKIAEALQCSSPHAKTLVDRAIERRRPLLDRDHKKYVDEQLMQIEQLYIKLEPLVTAPKDGPKYSEVLVKLMERKAKLLGLDKPSQVELVPPRQPIEGEIDPSRLNVEQLKALRELVAAANAAKDAAIDGMAVDITGQVRIAAPDAVSLDSQEKAR